MILVTLMSHCHHGGPRIKDTLLRKRDSGVILFMAVLMMILFDCYFVVT